MKENSASIPFDLTPRKKYEPMQDYMQLDYEKPEKIGQIIIPGQAQPTQYLEANVLAVGPKCTVKVGDRILFASVALLLIPVSPGNTVAITKEDKILAICR